MSKSKLVILFFLSTTYCFSQVEVVPIYRQDQSSSGKTNARTAALTPMALPFWDDFTVNIKNHSPNDTLWEADSRSVRVNNGTGLNPPSIYVATFDGYDATGKPYNTTDLLAKGYADVMTSRSLKLGDVAEANRDSVTMKFFYQLAGNGEKPEQGDILSLLFKNHKGQWIEVWSITNDGTLSTDQFIKSIKKINIRSKETSESKFFHNGFQFQFKSFGRLSGPYDVWNIDYVYVSNGKPKFNPANFDFPDRTVQSPLTSLLKDYQAMPVKHYFSNVTNNTVQPKVMVTNLREKQPGENVTYAQSIKISSAEHGITSSNTDLSNTVVPLPYDESRTVDTNIDNIASLVSAYSNDKKVQLKLSFLLKSGDMNDITNPLSTGDYDPVVYRGINFKSNDTVSTTHILSDYYAYDDGEAEHGINLTGKGTQLAYEFNMKNTTYDSIVAIDIYFPKYGFDTTQFVQIFIAHTLPANDTDYAFKQLFVVKGTTNNQFVRLPIPGSGAVKNKFYVGWQINSEAMIPIGLDRNSNSGDKIYVKVPGAETWTKNTEIYGSIMIRPVFGSPPKIISGVEPLARSKPYPNPTNGTFYLPEQAANIQLFDLSGQSVDYTETPFLDKKQISILSPTTGLLLVRYFNQQWVTEKIVVRP